jgi:hypothetical protein
MPQGQLEMSPTLQALLQNCLPSNATQGPLAH